MGEKNLVRILQAFRSDLDNAMNDISQLKAQIDANKKGIEKANDSYTALVGYLAHLEEMIRILSDQSSTNRKEIGVAEERMESYKTDIDKIKEAVNDLDAYLVEIRHKCICNTKDVDNQIEKLQTTVVDLNKEMDKQIEESQNTVGAKQERANIIKVVAFTVSIIGTALAIIKYIAK